MTTLDNRIRTHREAGEHNKADLLVALQEYEQAEKYQNNARIRKQAADSMVNFAFQKLRLLAESETEVGESVCGDRLKIKSHRQMITGERFISVDVIADY